MNQNLTLIKSVNSQIMDRVQYSLGQKIIGAVDKEILMRDLVREIQEIAGVSEKRAALIGADQVSKLNGKLVQYRQTNAGIERYIWRTMGDRRVRPQHAARSGISYRWDSPPAGGHPGEAIRCRCVAQPLIDFDSFKLVPKQEAYTKATIVRKIAINVKDIGESHIAMDKLVGYALNPAKEPNKAVAFEKALGYNLGNADKLVANIERNVNNFKTTEKSDIGYGKRFQLAMELVGENGKTANVMTAWILDKKTGEFRLTSIYIDK